ncbi:hypothetical protein Hdeb2414_s0003g00100101 [Helianthus debilis subsp. tardiflorus]
MVEKEIEKEKDKEKAAEKPVEKEKEKEKVVDKPEGDKTKEIGAPAATAHEKAQGPEVVHVMGLNQPRYEKKKELTPGKGPEVVKPHEPAHKETTTAAGGAAIGNVRSSTFAAGQAGTGSQSSMLHPPIGPKDTLGDIYYKTYTQEARGDAPHHPPWGLKQKDTFLEFSPCRGWFLNSFPPGEVNWQRERTHDGLYHAYIVGEANTRAANHQIVCEWRTMVKERGDWEKYRERLLRQVKDFEKMKAAFNEEKAKFESDRKSEEWGHEGLWGKLRAADDLLAKERSDWKEICKKNNQHMYAARAKITDLEAQNATLTKKVEDFEADKERFEAKRVKAATTEEAKQRTNDVRDISTSALNVAQNNYAKSQGIVDALVSEAEWIRGRGVVLMANSILNASELDAAGPALIDASHAVGHRGGYLECAQHVEEVFGQEFDVSHCSVTDQADAALAGAKGVYDHLSLPVMDLVAEALKHDNWRQRLKTILDPP